MGETQSKTTDHVANAPKEKQFLGDDVLCNICSRHGGECQIPIGKVTEHCVEQRTVCRECMERHILQCTEKSCFSIGCICTSKGCSAKLTFHDMQTNTSPELFQRYDQGLLHRTLEQDPEFCWCACTSCGSGQLHIRRDTYPAVQCHACHFRTCFTHHCEWHHGRTCQEYDEDARRSAELGLLQLLRDTQMFRRCPNCTHGVEVRLREIICLGHQ